MKIKELLFCVMIYSSVFAAAEEVPKTVTQINAEREAEEYIKSLGTFDASIERIIKILKPDASKKNPLRIAVSEEKTIMSFLRNDFFEILAILVGHPSPKHLLNENKTLLHYAASIYAKDKYNGKQFKAEVIKALLILGFDPNAQEEDGSTPLHYLIDFDASSGDTRSIEILLCAGANPNLRNRHGSSPFSKLLAKAESFNSSEMISLLKLFFKKGAEPWLPSRNDPDAPGNYVHRLEEFLWQESSSPFVMYGAEYIYRRHEAQKTYDWFKVICQAR